ncbi:uncharacterized protein RAG0_00900 [Rhynchosporium agropyri]|uniref:Dolichyl-diphosphooligosaccharide--protein glycosyltransferase subunit 4 n=1 Tax=Rhynchosporium agropyri TaxID=914238 RepID=A0A1E1JUM9_9HELO|nr:uncharacterized protein RAG0_00900 [Rhynchosporium agropyri]
MVMEDDARQGISMRYLLLNLASNTSSCNSMLRKQLRIQQLISDCFCILTFFAASKHLDEAIDYVSPLRPDHLRIPRRKQNSFTMISDNDLYRLAVFLGSAAMLLIVLYHFLEINAVEEPEVDSKGRPIPYADIRAASIGR